MTPAGLRQIMEQQNLSNQDLATICDVSYRQVMHWLSGKYPVPRTTAFLLLALNSNDTLTQDFLLKMLEQELREAAH